MIYETIFEIERLEQGYLILKDKEERIGINNENDLENKISKLLSNEVDVKNKLYFNNVKKMKISICIDYCE